MAGAPTSPGELLGNKAGGSAPPDQKFMDESGA